MFDPRKIWSSTQLPTLPTVAVRLLDLSRDPETELRDFVNLIKTDPAISAKVIKAANSTFFGFSAKLTSIDRAVPLLGTTMVTSLALSFSVVEGAVTRGPLSQHYSRYWLHSIVHAAAAETLASRFPGGQTCEHMLMGLLMDIGRLAMLKTIPSQYQATLDEWERCPNESLQDVENRTLGLDHLLVGSELMRNWNIPEPLRNAARLHHAPLAELKALKDAADAPLIQSAALAAATGDYFCTPAKGAALERLRELASTFLNLEEQPLQDLLTGIKARIDAAGELFAVSTSDLLDPSELMAQANEQLAQLAMREHVAGAQAAARHKAEEQQRRELEVQNAQLMQQALHDPLTRVYNRAFFDETLNKEVERCCRTADSLGVIFADVDKFKTLNDTYGHQFGDTVLKRIANCMAETIRTCDTLARYGGEEFVILVSQPTEKGIEKVAQRLRARIESEDITFGNQRVQVTASFGAAMTIPGRTDHTIGQRMIAAADEAMYQAKQSGRNCVRVRVVLSEFDRRLLQQIMQSRFSRWLVSHGVLDIETVSKAIVQVGSRRPKIGELSRRLGYVESQQVQETIRVQETNGKRFGETAIQLGFLSESDLANVLAVQQEDPYELAERLAAAGVLDDARGRDLAEQYLSERCPALVAT